jgi:3-oxoacyl-[acyl-carrier-protein] synthase-3
MAIKITGVGSYIPILMAPNQSFEKSEFYNEDGTRFNAENKVIIEKFKSITGISERRYVANEINNSDIGYFASKVAIEDSKIDPESIDYVIVAHNYGDISSDSKQSDTVPSIASRIKQKLKINNPSCVAYDILFGCPGWIEGMIQANAFIKAGIAKKCLVIGTETLSRIVDENDRDSMIFSDGAAAVILEETNDIGGVLSHESATYAIEEANYIYFGESFNPNVTNNNKYIKMLGRKIYEFALNKVPSAMKVCLDKSKIDISRIKKILIHQANEKMDEAIIKRFYKLYGMEMPENIMPMSIDKLGNSSVATVPTLYDLILKGNLENHHINTGDVIIFASVGAGMNINAMVYQV